MQSEPVDLVKASSGARGPQAHLQQDFALVLLDVQMPDLDGFEVARCMRSNPRTDSTPIIFVTAIGKEQRYIFRGYETGAVDYLFKPIDAAILRSKVRDLPRPGAQERLRLLPLSATWHQMLLRSLSEGLLGIAAATVSFANPTAEDMLGKPLSELIGRRLSEIFHLTIENGDAGLVAAGCSRPAPAAAPCSAMTCS